MSTEIQKLGTRLWRHVQGNGTKIVLVTSAVRGEGKSTTVAYLASALAMHPGRKILAMDSDMRNPSLNRYFNARVERTLTEVLKGECSVSEAIVHSGPQTAAGLDLLLPPEAGADPQVLLNTPRLTDTFRTLRGSYDLVLVDAPALIPVADAGTLIPVCDAVVLVVMVGVSTKHHLKRARELCLGLGGNILGLVVGNIQQAAPEYMDYDYYSYPAPRTKRSSDSRENS